MFEGGGVGGRVGTAETNGVGVGIQSATLRFVDPEAVTTGGESELLQAAKIAAERYAAIHPERIRRIDEAYSSAHGSRPGERKKKSCLACGVAFLSLWSARQDSNLRPSA